MKLVDPKNLIAVLVVAGSVALPTADQEAYVPILFTNVNVFEG
jgi:hypothetical protein